MAQQFEIAAANWTTDDSVTIEIKKEVPGQAKGDLRNPNFPSKVGPDESWEGTIDVVNAGDASGTFRIVVDGKTSDSFTLGAGEGGTLRIRGTGPAKFTIQLQRRV